MFNLPKEIRFILLLDCSIKSLPTEVDPVKLIFLTILLLHISDPTYLDSSRLAVLKKRRDILS